MMSLSAKSSAKIEDWSPNDWPESFLELRTIDNLLRCSICYEYFNAALMIPECCHNYCSLCIRKSLGFGTQCPTCATPVFPPDLRNNRVLDELVKTFVKIRVRLLDLVKNNADKKCTDKTISKEKQPVDLVKRGKVKRQQETPNRNTKRQKIDAETRKRDSTQITRKERVGTHADVLVIDESPPTTSAVHQFDQNRTSGAVSSVNLSECPVCGEMVDHKKINFHLDLCLVRGEKKSALRRQVKSKVKASTPESPKPLNTAEGFTAIATASTSSEARPVAGSNAFIKNFQKRRPLPKLVYELLSERELRQQLKKWLLPTKGDKQALIRRHQEFVVRYNAECDCSNPKSAAEIAREIEKTEKAKIKHSAKLSSTSTAMNLHFTRQSTEEEMDKARQQYLKEHQNDFARLIDDTRKRIKEEKKPFPNKASKVQSTDIASNQTNNEEISRTCEDAVATSPKNSNRESEEEETQPHGQMSSFSEEDKDNAGHKNELLPQVNQSKSNACSPEETGQLHWSETVIPAPPSSASLVSLQDEDLESTPSLSFEENDQEFCELEEDAELFPEPPSPVIKMGGSSDKDDDDDTDEFEF